MANAPLGIGHDLHLRLTSAGVCGIFQALLGGGETAVLSGEGSPSPAPGEIGGKFEGREIFGPLLRFEAILGRPWRKSFIGSGN